MKVTLLTAVILAALASLCDAADPECVYRKIRGLSLHWPNPTSCESYYRCSSKNTVRGITCPAGKEYNPRNGKCSTAGRGLCTLTLAAPLAETTNVCADEVSGAFLAKSGYCGEFYICDNQLAYPQTCTAGSYFNTTTNQCLPDADSECWQNQCIGQLNGKNLANTEYCAQFYICLNDEATAQSCSSGSYFNTTAEACVVDEDNSHCWENFCIGKEDATTIPDNDSCVDYYVCVDSKAVQQECANETYFDKVLLACVPGDCPDDSSTTTTTTTTPATGCDCADGSKSGELVADQENCRKYYICDNGVLVPGDCLKGNFFNSTLQVCQADTDNVCPESSQNDCDCDGKVVEDEKNCNQYYVCEDGTWLSKTCPVGEFFDTTCEKCVEDTDNVCPQCDADNGATTEATTAGPETESECKESDLPYKADNCWTYYACISGKWQKESCAVNSYFDSEFSICKQDSDNECPENKSKSKKKEKKQKVVRSRRSVEQENQEPQSDCCPGNIAEGSTVSHPTECAKYLICQNQQLVEGTCAQGNIFSSSQGVCVPDVDATCWICRGRPNGYQIPNFEDCTSYYTCSNGLATAISCGRDEWYNGASCEIDVTAKCINPCSCGTGNATNPICTKYYQCTDGVAKVADCPAGEGFDSSILACSSSSDCPATNCTTAVNGETYPVVDDNTKFYVCIDNTVEIQSCPAYKIYNTTYGVCLAEPSCQCDQSKCTSANLNSAYPSLDSDESSFCLCQSDGAYLDFCTSGYIFDNVEEICTFTGPCDPLVCVDEPEYSPSINYDDPNGFCLCRAGEPVPVECPIGYTFNNATLLCVLAPQPDPRCCRNYCKGKPEDLTFPAKNTDAGFCLCTDEVPTYHDCPVNKTYDDSVGLCLEINYCEVNECDPYLCLVADENQAFPVEGSPNNFCYCQNSCPLYASCPCGSTFDDEYEICLAPEVCNSTMCSSLAEYEPYLPNNGTNGFCYCVDNLPIYKTCPEEYEFSEEDGVCLSTVDYSIYCDSEKCSCLDDFDSFPSSNTEDDTSFCYCLNGTAIYDNCEGKKVYNASAGICMIPEAPDCVCTVGQCATLPENTVFQAKNDSTGYCSCVDGVAVYETCPDGKNFDTDYGICLEPAVKVTKEVKCDATQCYKRVDVKTFAARDTTIGYCTCEPDGTATYLRCLDEHVYDDNLKSCVVDACDAMQCRVRRQFEPFAARNTSKGFCSCDVTPTFNHCTLGHVFDTVLGACVDEMSVQVAVCDPLECNKRALFEPFASKTNADGFCSCDDVDGAAIFHECSDGKTFDSSLGMCIDKHSIQKRSVEPEDKFACEVNEKRSIPANCSQYEVCLDGNWRKRTCTEERYYNPELQRCIEPRDDMVCGYARVSGLPTCDKDNESETIASKRERGNCLQYFRCSAGKWRLRSCPKLHYYKPSVGTCLPMPAYEGDDFCSWINRTASTSECQPLSVRPSPNGCAFFLMCTGTGWWTHQCPLGMYFSKEHNYCIQNDANQCQLAVQPTTTNSTSCSTGERRTVASSCQSYEQCVQGQWLKRTCNIWQQFDPLLGCVVNDGSCQGNGLRRACNAADLRPLSQTDGNCTQSFYYCEADEWHLGSCLRGQSFVRDLRKCQSLEKCQALLSGTSSCLSQPDGQSVGHPDDCARFYICLQERPALLQSCAPGSFFDAALGYCRPNDGTCQQADSICANATVGFIPHARNCHAYYNCSISIQNTTSAQLLYCHKGQYFDHLTAQCRLDQGQCSSTAQTVQPLSYSELSLSLCTGQVHGMQLPHKQYCNLYYVCVRSLAILVQCGGQEYFSVSAGKCVAELESGQACKRGQLEESVAGSGVAATCSSLQDGSYVPDYRDCTKYYICAGGVALAQRCALGSYFDAEQLLCLPDDDVCPTAIRASGNETNADSPDRKMQPNPTICEGKHGYITADTANCNNFYICVSNKLRADRCYSGHFFNATLNQCQFINASETELEAKTKVNATVEQDSPEIVLQLQPAGKCTDEPTQFSSLCEVIAEGASLAVPGDCRRYISCDDNEPTSQRCRNGESYDSLLGICRQNDGTCLMENGERVGVCNKKHGQLARDVDNCGKYFICVHGQKIEAECQAGHYFSKTTNTCQEDILQQCVNNVSENGNFKPDE